MVNRFERKLDVGTRKLDVAPRTPSRPHTKVERGESVARDRERVRSL